jgi:hypothetical protein
MLVIHHNIPLKIYVLHHHSRHAALSVRLLEGE